MSTQTGVQWLPNPSSRSCHAFRHCLFGSASLSVQSVHLICAEGRCCASAKVCCVPAGWHVLGPHVTFIAYQRASHPISVACCAGAGMQHCCAWGPCFLHVSPSTPHGLQGFWHRLHGTVFHLGTADCRDPPAIISLSAAHHQSNEVSTAAVCAALHARAAGSLYSLSVPLKSTCFRPVSPPVSAAPCSPHPASACFVHG